MLQHLTIQHYAIIEELDVQFASGLNIITGETGAGKSILIGALGLILGDRADTSVLSDPTKKCIVEAVFREPGRPALEFLRAGELDVDDATITIRREISAQGKSRSFVNDTPVTLQQLRSLGSLLVDLHQQFDTLELGSQSFQREVIDALAGHEALLNEYQQAFRLWQQELQELQRMQAEQATAQAALDYHQFLYNELEDANFQSDELEQLDQELLTLTHAEQVQSELESAVFQLRESELPLIQQLKSLVNRLHTISAYKIGLDELIKRLQSTQVELQDITSELAYAAADVSHDPERLQWVNDRLALGYRLQKKHQVQDTAGLLAVQADLQEKLSFQLNLDQTIAQLERSVQERRAFCTERASVLTQQRQAVLPSFMANVNRLLTQVGMPNARLEVRLQPTSIHGYGADDIQFLFDANKSGRFEPLHKVASGGELSRMMLSIKSLVAAHVQLPTLIFDEIDTGISGEAAKQVGMIMEGLAGSHQLIAITHQPQIAARAHAHYFVYKSDRGKGAIQTGIRTLSIEERVEAIAQMLSGEKPTEAALANAREMVTTS